MGFNVLEVNDTSDSVGASKTRITVWEIGKIVPNSVLPSVDNVADVLGNLSSLRKAGLLNIEVGSYSQDPEQFLFSLTVNGMIYFRKHVKPIVKIIEEEAERYPEIIDKTDADSAVKREFKTLESKLKGKTEDEAINALVVTVKRMLPQGVTFLAKLIIDNFH